MRRLSCRLNCLGLLLALIIVLTAFPALSQNKPVLTYAFSNGSPPYSYGEGSQCRGILYDLLRYVIED